MGLGGWAESFAGSLWFHGTLSKVKGFESRVQTTSNPAQVKVGFEAILVFIGISPYLPLTIFQQFVSPWGLPAASS